MIHDIQMTDIRDEAIVFQTDYADRPAGFDSNQPAQTQNFLPDFSDIHISRVVCRGCATAVRASGTLATVHDITLKDCTLFYHEKAAVLDDSQMIRMDNVRFLTF